MLKQATYRIAETLVAAFLAAGYVQVMQVPVDPPPADSSNVIVLTEAEAAPSVRAELVDPAILQNACLFKRRPPFRMAANTVVKADEDLLVQINENFNILQLQIDALKKGARGPAGADGKDGAPGIAGKDGQPGPPGKDGRSPSVDEVVKIVMQQIGEPQRGPAGPAGVAGRPGKDGVSPSVDSIVAAVIDKIPAGKDGRPGKDGINGLNGKDGKSPPLSEIVAAVLPQIPKGPAGERGPAGPQGLAGPAGPAGARGQAGKDGVSPSAADVAAAINPTEFAKLLPPWTIVQLDESGAPAQSVDVYLGKKLIVPAMRVNYLDGFEKIVDTTYVLPLTGDDLNLHIDVQSK